jgi:type II secretory pathway predicted ATPase ExeA
MDFEPTTLKQLIIDCDISQSELAKGIEEELGRPVSRGLVNLGVNRGYIPPTVKGFRDAVETLVRQNPRATAWLLERRLTVAQVWQPLEEKLRLAMPAGHGKRSAKGAAKGRQKQKGIELDDPTKITVNWEVEMLHPEAMKQFKLFRHPFMNDVNSEKDIYLSDEHRYIEAAIMDAAQHSGFLAVIGEVQSGKSTIRKKVMENLLKDGGVSIIYPRSHKINLADSTHSRINAVSLCDAIIMDISDEKPKIKTEHKVRQLERLLIQRSNQGMKHVLIIEEAHNLTKVALKYLKQFHELEDGFRKLMSVIIIGQTELRDLLDEKQYPDLREVIRRIQVAEIKGLNGSLRNYLEFKFKRIGADIKNIFAEDFFEAISLRLTAKDNRDRKISNAYPGLVNTYVTRAMNLAWEMGEERVTADVVMAL